MKINDLTVGIDFKRCSECEYKNNDLRNNLLVTAGVRAGCMDMSEHINLPTTIEGEHEVALYISRKVDYYLASDRRENFDEFIEKCLIRRFGVENA